jgi:hypothetical protein
MKFNCCSRILLAALFSAPKFGSTAAGARTRTEKQSRFEEPPMHLPAARHCTPIVPGAIVAEAEVTR